MSRPTIVPTKPGVAGNAETSGRWYGDWCGGEEYGGRRLDQREDGGVTEWWWRDEVARVQVLRICRSDGEEWPSGAAPRRRLMPTGVAAIDLSDVMVDAKEAADAPMETGLAMRWLAYVHVTGCGFGVAFYRRRDQVKGVAPVTGSGRGDGVSLRER
ncbi:hypothetical protein V8G54_019245 [Vigna mungo]|uniref:Uncharacterized protein n=1 Tax=Vigna mungo TaxID=3915 RepID=A0AAQ3RVE9_VIGMU